MGRFFLKITSGEVRKLEKFEREKYSNYKYVCLSEFAYEYGGIYIYIPPGFLTDGSSGGPDYGSSWLFHDFLYATHKFTEGGECTREKADKIMEQILVNEGMSVYSWIFLKVSKLNIFGLFSKAWRESGERGSEFID